MNFVPLLFAGMTKYAYSLIFFVIFSCNHPKENKNITFVKVDELEVEVPGFMTVNPSVIQLIESDSGNFLFVYNNISKNFQFVDLHSGDLVREVPLTYEGPNSVQGLSGGAVNNLDSIWITFTPPGIGLINFRGEVLIKRKIENDLFPVTYLGAKSNRSLYRDGNKIFGPQTYFMKHHGMRKEDIKKHQLVYSYDFRSDSVQWYDVFYPDDFWDQGKKMSEYSWTQRGKKMYIAPWNDHEIQVFDMEAGKVTGRHQVKSNYIDNFFHVNELPASADEGMKNLLEHDIYGGFMYDQYRDLFYRIFIPGFKLEEDYSIEDLNRLELSRPHMGIMVLDKDLNILGEHVFEKFEVYSFANHFVGKKGLYLSTNNSFNQDYDEDNFKYIVLQVEIDEL